jgi:AAA+ superfamily predicted ATPase
MKGEMIMIKNLTYTTEDAIFFLLKLNNDPYFNSRTANTASRRFFKSAQMLSPGGFLGLQLCAGKDSFSWHAFSDPGSGLTPEDLDWIFQGIGTAQRGAESSPKGFEENSRRIYALTWDPSTEEQRETDGCREFFDMLREENGMLQITTGSTSDADPGSGTFCVSLPNPMSIRMRSTLSLIFPELQIRETSSICPESCALPAHVLAECTEVLLYGLSQMAESCCGEAEIPLEDLGFSFRTLNCLKRAGIRTLAQLRAKTEEDLMQMRNLGKKGLNEVLEVLEEMTEEIRPVPKRSADHAASLEELIGLDAVKAQVRRIAAFARMKREMQANGQDTLPLALNMEFTGNPGTAKTTVARILAGIFFNIGLLSSPELIEAGRADLVGRYVGQTAGQVRSVFESARGKLLFIDEAYSLVENQEGSYGDEAIATILQEIENNRDRNIVIFAGYPAQMEELFRRNPGFRSRVPFTIHFEDYSPEEMVQIAGLEAKKRGFTIDPAARPGLEKICGSAGKGAEAGNGRFCRNLVENAILNYAERAYSPGSAAQKDHILREKDFTLPEKTEEHSARPIGFLVS